MHVLRESTGPSEVLLVHAPYPGALKFSGVPSSLFSAIGPFVAAHGPASVSYFDPVTPSECFYRRLQDVLALGSVRVLCISTSTAAIEECSRVAGIAARVSPNTLVVVGGPHEDAVETKVAVALPSVHLSIAGDAGLALKVVLECFLDQNVSPARFLGELPAALASAAPTGEFTVSCAAWPQPFRSHLANQAVDLRPQVRPELYPAFSVFSAPATVPVMVSRGCPYGRCTFCSEASPDGKVAIADDFDWIAELAAAAPGAALYFQDSIFPGGHHVRERLLPLLRQLGREWGCQVYLPMLTERRVAELSEHGCTYLYTGIESGAAAILNGIRKPGLHRELVLERVRWVADHKLTLGLSLMFGAMATTGVVLENRSTLEETHLLASSILDTGVSVAGFYPNVQTVLPGTPLADGLRRHGAALDFYHVPRTSVFDGLEDGGVGYNFLSLAPVSRERQRLAMAVVEHAERIRRLVGPGISARW